MKHLASVALMLNLGVAGIWAQQRPVNMRFSGNAGASAIDLKWPNTTTGEQNLAGHGTLGPFTFRLLRAAANAPQPSNTCSGVFIPTPAGGGIFRFQDGSLLKVTLTGGGDCIDLVHQVAHCTSLLQITGGTGRFQGASGGALTLTETARPALADYSGHPTFFTEDGEITGTVSGVPTGDKEQGNPQ